jgi:hypothetical protein
LSGEVGWLTHVERAFLEPANVTDRHYEALRAYFVDKVPSKEEAARFGYSPGSFRVPCHDFRSDPGRAFFLPSGRRAPNSEKGPGKTARLRDKVKALRKQNLSVYDISAVLAEDGGMLSPPAIWTILSAEDFARLPRRAEEERVGRVGVTPGAVADVRAVDLSSRQFRTEVGGLFLFVPMLAGLGFDELMAAVGLPGSKMVPAGQAMRSLLTHKRG